MRLSPGVREYITNGIAQKFAELVQHKFQPERGEFGRRQLATGEPQTEEKDLVDALNEFLDMGAQGTDQGLQRQAQAALDRHETGTDPDSEMGMIDVLFDIAEAGGPGYGIADRALTTVGLSNPLTGPVRPDDAEPGDTAAEQGDQTRGHGETAYDVAQTMQEMYAGTAMTWEDAQTLAAGNLSPEASAAWEADDGAIEAWMDDFTAGWEDAEKGVYNDPRTTLASGVPAGAVMEPGRPLPSSGEPTPEPSKPEADPNWEPDEAQGPLYEGSPDEILEQETVAAERADREAHYEREGQAYADEFDQMGEEDLTHSSPEISDAQYERAAAEVAAEDTGRGAAGASVSKRLEELQAERADDAESQQAPEEQATFVIDNGNYELAYNPEEGTWDSTDPGFPELSLPGDEDGPQSDAMGSAMEPGEMTSGPRAGQRNEEGQISEASQEYQAAQAVGQPAGGEAPEEQAPEPGSDEEAAQAADEWEASDEYRAEQALDYEEARADSGGHGETFYDIAHNVHEYTGGLDPDRAFEMVQSNMEGIEPDVGWDAAKEDFMQGHEDAQAGVYDDPRTTMVSGAPEAPSSPSAPQQEDDQPSGKRKRCEVGTHKDPKTGQCKPIQGLREYITHGIQMRFAEMVAHKFVGPTEYLPEFQSGDPLKDVLDEYIGGAMANATGGSAEDNEIRALVDQAQGVLERHKEKPDDDTVQDMVNAVQDIADAGGYGLEMAETALAGHERDMVNAQRESQGGGQEPDLAALIEAHAEFALEEIDKPHAEVQIDGSATEKALESALESLDADDPRRGPIEDFINEPHEGGVASDALKAAGGQGQAQDEPKKRSSRCEKGTRKDPKTGQCKPHPGRDASSVLLRAALAHHLQEQFANRLQALVTK